MNRLRLLRNKKNKSQTEMAEILNVSRQAYNFYENGVREPKLDMIIKMADFFDVSVDYLLGRTDFLGKYKNFTSDGSEQVKRLQKKISSTDTQTAAEVENYLDYLEAQKSSSLQTSDGK